MFQKLLAMIGVRLAEKLVVVIKDYIIKLFDDYKEKKRIKRELTKITAIPDALERANKLREFQANLSNRR